MLQIQIQRLTIFFLVSLILMPTLVSSWCKDAVITTRTQIKHMAVSPGGKYLAVANINNLVTFYHTRNYIEIGKYNAAVTINVMRFSNDGYFLAIGAQNNILFLNGYEPFGLNSSFDGRVAGTVSGLDFSSDSSKFLVCGASMMHLFNVNIATAPSTWTSIPQTWASTINECRISPFNQRVASSISNQLRIYDLALVNSPPSFTTGSIVISKMVFDPLANFLVYISSGSSGNRLYFYNIASNATTSIAGTSNTLYAVDYSSSGKFISTGGQQKILYIYESSRTTPTQISTADKIKSIIFNKDLINTKMFVGDISGEILVLALNCARNCASDYFYDNTTCVYCADMMSKCVTCANATVCDTCVDGFYVDPNDYKCKSCDMLGCRTCLSLNYCSQCHSGFYIATSGSLRVCRRCSDTAIMEGCAICNSSILCVACNNDHYLVDTGTNKCRNCSQITNCLKCNNGTFCMQCQAGYFPNAGSCVACGAKCLMCQGTATNCSQCTKGWYVDIPTSYTCTRCQSNCLSCNNSNKCFECINGMYQKADGSCELCAYSCVSCENDTICYNCAQGYHLSGTTCLACINNCATCNTTTYCATCLAGFYLTATTCRACSLHYNYCEYCTSSVCQSCQMGYFLNASVLCQHCSETMFKCQKCSTGTVCLSCLQGFYHTGLTANASCKSCELGCQTCINGIDCRKCFSNYYLDTSAKCLLCPSNCLECADATTCIVCNEKYYLDGVICKICTQNLTNCLQCWNGSQCASCLVGYYLDAADKKCKICTGNCLTCDSSKCFSCVNGYFLTTAALPVCQICSEACTQCVTAANCTGCTVGFYLDTTSSTCKNCSYNRFCRTCNINTCYSCQKGYYLDNTISPPNFKCTNCLTKIQGCVDCNATNYCFACDYGYYRHPTSNLCVSCTVMNGCQKCSSGTVCSSCVIGYFFNTSSLCQICKTGCSSCNPSGDCFTCSLGYYKSTVNCLPCKNNIQGCDLCSSSVACVQCMNGYYLDTGSSTCKFCRSAMIGCLYCNTSAICTNCQPGFYLDSANDKCETCSKTMMGCQICKSSGICTDCQGGYYLTGGGGSDCTKCIASIPGCISCTDINTCMICTANFYLDTDDKCKTCFSINDGCNSCDADGAGGIICYQCSSGLFLSNVSNLCEPCQTQGCEICHQSNAALCVSCDSLYYMTGSTCTKCSASIVGCTQCISNILCTICDTGYFLNTINKCNLCQVSLPGCGKCIDNSGTLQCTLCKSSYILNITTHSCETCYSVIQGCTFCVNSSECISCSNGYFKDPVTKLCRSCNEIDGCLLCVNQLICEYCSQNYYLDNVLDQCVKCSDSIQFCMTCLEPTRCLSCQSGYIVNEKFQCEAVTVTATDKPKGIKLITEFIDKDTLSHTLYIQNDQFKNTAFDLTGMCNLYLTDYSQLQTTKVISQILLIIKKKNWLSSTQLQFFTDNPTNINADQIAMIRRRLYEQPQDSSQVVSKVRLLSSSASSMANFKVSLQMSQQAVNTILPNLYQTGDLVLDYSLDQPQFYMSYLKYSGSESAHYSIFGYLVCCLLLLNFMYKTYKIKSLAQVNHHFTGQILSHMFSLKAVTLFNYPITFEYYYFCYGFMLVDLPWMNLEIGAIFGERSDYVPQELVMYFYNLNIASTFMLALSVFIVLMALRFVINKKKQLARNKYTKFIYCVFIFGLTFAGSLSLQGALFNPIKKMSLNAFFYLAGIIIYFGIFIEMLHSLNSGKDQFYKVRIFIKASLLSIGHMNPIIVIPMAVIIDILLLVVQYIIVEKEVSWSKFWMANHVMLNLSVAAMFLLPNSFVSLIIAIIFASIVVIIELLLNFKLMNYCQEQKSIRKKEQQIDQKNMKRQRIMSEPFGANNQSMQTFINDKQLGKMNLWDIEDGADFGSLHQISIHDERIDQLKKEFSQANQTRQTSFGITNNTQENDFVMRRKPRNQRKVSKERQIHKSHPLRVENSGSSSPTDESANSNEEKDRKMAKLHFLTTANKIPIRSRKRSPQKE